MSEFPFNRAEVLAVRCPHCGAAPGDRCKRPSGALVEGSYFHNERKAVVYPRFAHGEGGLKRGRVGTVRVFAIAYQVQPFDVMVAVCLARSEVAATERLRLRAGEVLKGTLEVLRVIELDARDGDQLLMIGVDT